MSKKVVTLIVLGSIAFLGYSGVVGAAQIKPPANVNIVNTPTVTGTVNVGNFPPVQNVSDIDNPAVQPFQSSASVTMSDGQSNFSALVTTVPAGKRLVIEWIGVLAVMPSGQSPFGLTLGTTTSGTFVAHRGVAGTLLLTASTSSDFYESGAQVRLYADPETTVAFGVSRDIVSGSATVTVTVSGYLVDLVP